MNKYLNVIIFAFFSILTTKFGIGLNLFIPIATFLVLINFRNIVFVSSVSFLSLYLYNQDALVPYLIFIGLLSGFSLLNKNTHNHILESLFVFTSSIITSLLLIPLNEKINFLVILIYSFIGTICFAYFKFNMEGSLNKQNKVRNFAYCEFIMAIISVFGASTLSFNNINLALFVSIFFCMYLSQNKYEVHSLFFSIITMFVLKFVFNINESILIPLASAFYMFQGLYGSITLISFCLFAWLGDFKLISDLTLQITIILSLFFEIVKYSIISSFDDSDEINYNIYDNLIETLNAEVIGFATFLDYYSKNFVQSLEYDQKINEGIKTIISRYCMSCHKRTSCYNKNQTEINNTFKTFILYSKRSDLELLVKTDFIFTDCPYIEDIKRNSIIINEKLQIPMLSQKNNVLVAQINAVSNILKQYSIDFTTRNELSYDLLEKIKQSLIDYGINLTFFNCKRIFKDDFLIEIGIRGMTFSEIELIVKRIFDNYISSRVSVIYLKTDRRKTYINIVPEIKYNIEYGYGSVAQDGNTISGDNYLIKELDTSRVIAAISDGMGKGYQAFRQSNKTLELIDKVTDWQIDTQTSLQIINTFFNIEEYQEKYSTLDFLEINRSNGKMNIIKMGASSSFVFHDNGDITVLDNKSLPFGLEELIEIDYIDIKDKDLIIMASDGVIDYKANANEMKMLINNVKDMPPQKIAYQILDHTLKKSKKYNDDMSIIALKVSYAK